MLSNGNITAGTNKDPLQRSAYGHARQNRATVTLYITCDDVRKDTEPIYHWCKEDADILIADILFLLHCVLFHHSAVIKSPTIYCTSMLKYSVTLLTCCLSLIPVFHLGDESCFPSLSFPLRKSKSRTKPKRCDGMSHSNTLRRQSLWASLYFCTSASCYVNKIRVLLNLSK